MAQPLQTIQQLGPKITNHPPKTVVSAKEVRLALVSYTDEFGDMQTQLAVIGEKNIHLLNGKSFGITQHQTPQGVASSWLAKGIFQKLDKEIPEASKKGSKK